MRRPRPVAVVAILTAVVVAALIWSRATDDGQAEVVGDSPAQDGWKVLEHDGVRVDIPSAWGRLDTDDCEFRFERWAAPATALRGILASAREAD